MKKALVGIMLSMLCAINGMGQYAAKDFAKQVGIFEMIQTWSANVGDYNNDGWPDIMISHHYGGAAQLFRNNNGTSFTEVFPGNFPGRHPNSIPVDRHDCAWGDVNGDGLLDLYCTEGADYGMGYKENELWIQTPTGFVDKSKEYGVMDPWGRGRFCTFIDVNRDGLPDLFVANETGRSDGHDSRNHLWLNQGQAPLVPAPQYGLDLAIGGGQCVRPGDFDNDGWMDLLVCAGGSYPRVYHNNQGTSFTDISAQMGLTGVGSWRDVFVADFNGDGQLDIAMVRRGRFQVMLQRSGKFQAPTSVFGGLTAGEKLAAGDINRDGLPDIYILQGGDAATHVTAATNPNDWFLINNGDGKFSRITAIPQTWQGQGQHVSPIDFDQDGITDFIVLNGLNKAAGPVQLIKF